MYMPSWSFVLGFASIFCSLTANVFAFSFTNTDPTQCDNIIVNWKGGTAPFFLHLIPIFDSPKNITLPSTAFSNGKGSYSAQVPFSQGKQMLIAMSDAQGFGTGGVSSVMVVGGSQGGACDTKGPGVAFTYQLNTALQQCRPYTISDYTGAIQPVTVYGVVPRGKSFSIYPPAGPTSYDWIANVASGTDVVFFMADARGRQGGTSDVVRVGISDDSTCINSSSPSSTTSGPPSSQTTGSSTAGGPTDNTVKGGFTIAAVAGTVIGAVLFLAMVITMGLYFFRRKRETYPRPPPFSLNDDHPPEVGYADVSGAAPEPYPYMASTLSTNASTYPLRAMDPYGSTTPSQYHSVADQSFSRTNSVMDFESTVPALRNPHDSLPPPRTEARSSTSVGTSSYYANQSAPTTTTTSKKARSVALQPPARYIIHTDVEDFVPQPDENGIVELPPTYSERRAPITIANPTSELPYAQPPNLPPSQS